MNRALLGLALLCACLVPSLASAQEAGKIGVTMGFPSGVGVIWHVSDTVAMRPEFSFSHSSVDTPLGETSSNSFGLGLTALFYTKRWENAAMYFAPRVAWSRSKSESRADLGRFIDISRALTPPPFDVDFDTESTADSYVYSGSIGAQGWIGRRFSVFGEVGVAYSTGSSDADSLVSFGDTSLKAFNIRSGVGAVLYF